MSMDRILKNSVLFLLVGAVAAATSGCGSNKMMPTPTVFRTGEVDPFRDLPDEFRTGEVEVFFATDRKPQSNPSNPGSTYGPRSGDVLRLGRARVRLGSEDLDWAEVKDRSLDDRHLGMKITHVEEFGKLWTTIPQPDPDFDAADSSVFADDPIRAPADAFVEAINERLDATESRQIVIYVPGFNTKFKDTTQQIAQAVHFMDAMSWGSRTPGRFTTTRLSTAPTVGSAA